MPYDIRKINDGYKVCKKGTKKCFSNDPIPLSNAVKQRKAIAISEKKGYGYFDDYDWSKITEDDRREKIYDYIRDLPDNKEHYAIDEEWKGGDIDWWGIAKDVGSDLYKQGKDFITQFGETEEQKQARLKKEEACKLCNEGSGMFANSGFYRTDPKRLKGGVKCPITGGICECKGGKQYKKDKYKTKEKELTDTEKTIVKREFGEGNPEIAEISKEPMGDDDIRKYFPNAKIIKYSELSKYNDITQLLPKDKSFFFLLYERSLNVGHWVLVSRYKDNGIDTIEFFCSYGSKIDNPLTWTPIGMRKQLGQDKPYLSMLFDKSPFRIIYNPVQYQSKKSNIATCGAYDTLRASELQKHNTTLDEFNEMLKDVKNATGLNYDEIVTNLIDIR